MASKPAFIGLILLILIVLVALFLATNIYNSYQRNPTIRETQENLEDVVDNAKDSLKHITIPITTINQTFFLQQ